VLRKLLLLVNPMAGQRRAGRSIADIVRVFSDYGWETVVYITKARGDATDYVREHAGEFEMIVLSGGDGTLNEVFSGMLQANVRRPIGYIPAGTTNDYASTLGLSHNPVRAARDVMTGSVRTLDLGMFNGRCFAYTASFGMFTKASYATPQQVKNALGTVAYFLEGIKDIAQIHPIHVRLETEDRVEEGEFLFGSVSNSTSVAGILKLDKNVVNLSDGRFEVLLVRSFNTPAMLSRAFVGLGRQDFTSEPFVFFSAEKVKITVSGDVDWTLDGEYAHGSDEIDIENRHLAIDIIVPEPEAQA